MFHLMNVKTTLILLCLLLVPLTIFGKTLHLDIEKEIPDLSELEEDLLNISIGTGSTVKILMDSDHVKTVKTGENFTVEKTETHQGSVTIIGGNTDIQGVLEGDLVITSGNLLVSGTITGDILATGGNIDLRDHAVIKGNLMTLGGTVQKSEDVVVEGEMKTVDAGKYLSKLLVPIGEREDTLVKNGEFFHIPLDSAHSGDVAVRGGRVNVEGILNGDLAVLGGVVEISGSVNGNVVLIAGQLVLMKNAEINGEVAALGGELKKQKGSIIRGSEVDLTGFPLVSTLMRWVLDQSDVDIPEVHVETPNLLYFHYYAIAWWFLITIIIMVCFGRNADQANQQMRAESGKCLLTGFLFHTGTLLALLILLSLLLAFGLLIAASLGIIGIPLFFAATLLLLAVIIFWIGVGLFAVPVGCLFIGNRIMTFLGRPHTPLLVSSFIGLLILGACRFIPFGFGFLIWHIWAMVAIGATVLSKFGTHKPWFSRKTGLKKSAAEKSEANKIPEPDVPSN
ncbi:hypothetical protein JW979_10105 [bacterium]|nr:hypothetical protein [candidate division CSSED10-310 bacterium]